MVHDGSSAEETIYRRATSCVMIDPILHILADSSVFQGLSERELQDVREAATMRRYVAGELMVRQEILPWLFICSSAGTPSWCR